METGERLEIIAAYGTVLAGRRHSVASEASLPYPKDRIHEALSAELEHPTHPEYLKALAVGYVQLESFLPEVEADLVRASEDLLSAAHKLIETGEEAAKEQAVAMVRQIPEEVPAIRRRLQERMAVRLKEVESLRGGTAP
jgi:hypothetical protein